MLLCNVFFQSQIPIATKTEEELAEKRKALRKIKKEKEKEKRKENEIKRKDQDEKDRYLKLSDREKVCLYVYEIVYTLHVCIYVCYRERWPRKDVY